MTSYNWTTKGCYNNAQFTKGGPECFADVLGQTKQKVTVNNLNAEDAGAIICTASINGSEYTSQPFTFRISGEQLIYFAIACIVILKHFYHIYTICYDLCIEVYSL